MPTKYYISTKGMDITEWLEKRKALGIGGSEVSAILGYNSYKTAVDVWIEKTAESVITTPDNEAMWIGREIEPMLRKRFTEETGLKVLEDHKIRLHRKHDCLFCNLDGMILSDEGPGVFEAKAFLSYETDKYDSVVPPSVFLQVQHNMSVTGWKYGYVIIWLKDRNEFIIQRINRNEKLIADMNNKLIEFWNHNVKEHQPPAPNNEDDLRKLYTPGEEGKRITATDEIYEQWRELQKTKEEMKNLKNKEDMLRYQIESAMQDAEILEDQTGTILATWKTSSAFNEDGLKEDEPDLYAEFCTKFDRSAFKKKHRAKDDKYMLRTGPRKFLLKTP